MKKILFQEEPINTNEIINETGTEADGSVITFIGMARNFSRGKEVTHLEYEIYENMAEKEMEKIIDESIKRWKLSSCIVVHRYGRVNMKEASILISLSSPHRKESFQASQYIIDTIKERVPIWKKEFYIDGSQWISERS